MNQQRKNLRAYIIPAMISNIAFFLLSVVDGMFVGNGVSDEALGAINLAMPFVMVVGAIAVLFSIGGVAITAIRLGREDVEGSNQSFMHAVALTMVVFSLLTVVGTVFSEQVAVLLGARGVYVEMVSDYVFWYSVFLIPVAMFTCLSSFCRNDGEPKLSTVAVISYTLLNIFGDWLLVIVLDYGISGAAFATGFSQIAACAILSVHFLRKRGKLRLCRFRSEPKLYGEILLRGLPDLVSQLASPITTYSMNRILVGMGGGSEAGNPFINAYAVINYVGALFTALMYGLSTGLQPLYGKSYGAGDDKSLRFYFRSGLTMSVLGGIGLFGLAMVVGKPFCMLLNADAAAAEVVLSALPKYCLSYVFAASAAVIASYLLSTKRTPYATAINTCRSVVFNFLCINFLPLLFGEAFVWYTMAVAEAACLLIAAVLCRISERRGIVYR